MRSGCYLRSKTATKLPDLENLLLPEIMRLPLSGIAAVAEPVLSAFMPPQVKRLFDLNTAMMVLLEKRAIASVPELDDGEIVALQDLRTMFTAEEKQAATDWLSARLEVSTSTTSEALLKAALNDGLTTAVCQCIALLLYQSFADDSPARGFNITINGNRFRLTFANGSSLTLRRRKEFVNEYQG